MSQQTDTPQAIRDSPDNLAGPVDQCIATTDFDRRRINAVVDEIPVYANRILDVGCVRHDRSRRAYGNLHAQLHVEYPAAEIVGIDIDSPETHRMQSPGYDIRCVDCQEMYLDGSFDAIVAGEVIEHLPNPGQFLKRAEEHLRPSGRIIVSTPNPAAISYLTTAAAGNWTSDDHTCWMDAQQLQTLVDRSTDDCTVASVDYLEPAGKVSKLVYKYGRERLGAGTYVAVIQ